MTKPLEERICAALARHGPATSDTLGRRLQTKAKIVSARLSELVTAGRVTRADGDGGEDVYSAAG